MSKNREKRPIEPFVHVLMALKRGQGKKGCMRVVERDYNDDLAQLELRCLQRGGEWRIHKTVNARDMEKARVWLIHKLIDNEGMGCYVDTQWKTALMQSSHIYGCKRFMLDIDTKYALKISAIESLVEGFVLERHESPKGWHYITKPFDTRLLSSMDDVSVLRDGYYYIKTVGSKEGQ